MPAMPAAPLLLAALLAAGGALPTAPAAAGGGPTAPPPGRVVEQVVAVVRTPSATQPRVITLTRLTEETRIALVSRGAAEAATAELDAAALRAGLEWLVDQILLLDEVVRLQVYEVDRGDVLEELRRFQERFAAPGGYRAFLAAADLTEEELLVVLRRMLRVQRYVDSRVAGAARVKEVDVDRWLAAQGVEPEDRVNPAVRTAARATLAEERTRREVKALLADLRGRAAVRILDRPGAEDGRP